MSNIYVYQSRLISHREGEGKIREKQVEAYQQSYHLELIIIDRSPLPLLRKKKKENLMYK